MEVIFGHARFSAPDRIEVLRPGGLAERADRPALRHRHRLAPLPSAGRRLQPPAGAATATRCCALEHTPRSITIYGAGVIGCEYASILSNLDVKVNLVNTRDRLLSFLDDEITDAL